MNSLSTYLEAFSAFNTGVFDYWMIAEAYWKRMPARFQDSGPVSAEIIRRNSYMAVIRAGQETGGFLRLTLVKLQSEQTDQDKMKREKMIPVLPGSAAFQFTEDEVSGYLRGSKDTNPIHQTSRPVVPGLYILSRLLEGGVIPEDAGCVRIRFTRPLPAGETVWVTRGLEPGGKRRYGVGRTGEYFYFDLEEKADEKGQNDE